MSKGKGKFQATKAERGSRLIALNMVLDRGGWSILCPGCFTPGTDQVYVVWEAGWAPVPIWMGAENVACAGIQSPDHPACSLSLY